MLLCRKNISIATVDLKSFNDWKKKWYDTILGTQIWFKCWVDSNVRDVEIIISYIDNCYHVDASPLFSIPQIYDPENEDEDADTSQV